MAARRPRSRYPGTDSQKWNVRTYAGEILARGFDGYKSASAAAAKLGGVPSRA